ncbi:hypothetical protein B0H10DRAFT_2325589 [Mycena sp. CBHHK59/15]|nr:hypothetical protein B0H10DRAFT_2325589 [Mycena sp. CBHHK59/15]
MPIRPMFPKGLCMGVAVKDILHHLLFVRFLAPIIHIPFIFRITRQVFKPAKLIAPRPATQMALKGYRVYQRVGEAVMIPVGCAHQVQNLSDCIKVAIDFTSVDNIECCEKLTQEFRGINDGGKPWKVDMLQLRSLLWFTWATCCREEDRQESQDGCCPGVESL